MRCASYYVGSGRLKKKRVKQNVQIRKTEKKAECCILSHIVDGHFSSRKHIFKGSEPIGESMFRE